METLKPKGKNGPTLRKHNRCFLRLEESGGIMSSSKQKKLRRFILHPFSQADTMQAFSSPSFPVIIGEL